MPLNFHYFFIFNSGPPWLPFIGNYLLLHRKKSELGYYHIVWDSLARTYGPIVGLRLGKDRIVIVSGKDAVSEVLTRDDFDGRPDGFFFKMRTFGQRLGKFFFTHCDECVYVCMWLYIK